jgi:hypothetical protein
MIRPSLVQCFDQLGSGYVKVDSTPMHLQFLFTFMHVKYQLNMHAIAVEDQLRIVLYANWR